MKKPRTVWLYISYSDIICFCNPAHQIVKTDSFQQTICVFIILSQNIINTQRLLEINREKPGLLRAFCLVLYYVHVIGGGFVFDCRAIHNPGRYEPYKKLTGMDAPVIEFLEKESNIAEFLENAYAMVDNMVDTYMKRGFTHVQVCCGCTGGQHRSVYSAEHIARHVADKFGVKVVMTHKMLERKYIIPSKNG